MTAPAITDSAEALAVLRLANLLDSSHGHSIVLVADGAEEYAATGYGDPAEALRDVPTVLAEYEPTWDAVYIVGHHTNLDRFTTIEQRETVRVRVR